MATDGPLRALKRRRELRRRLRRLAPVLRPGQWRLAGALAGHEAITTSEEWAARRAADRDTGTGENRLERLWPGRMTLTAEHPPAAADDDFEMVIMRRDTTILIPAERASVVRVGEDPAVLAPLVENARWLRRSYPCPAIEPYDLGIPGLTAAREEFMAGTPLHDAPREMLEGACRQLLEACRDHAALCDGVYRDASEHLETILGWSLPGWLHDAVRTRREAIRDLLDAAPVVRAHADCHNGNVLVGEGGRIALIDLERVQTLPFFFDGLSLFRGTSAADGHLRRRYLAGVFDDELNALWSAAGRAWPADGHVPALLAMALLHAFRPQFAGMKASRRRDKFIAAADKFAVDCGLKQGEGHDG